MHVWCLSVLATVQIGEKRSYGNFRKIQPDCRFRDSRERLGRLSPIMPQNNEAWCRDLGYEFGNDVTTFPKMVMAKCVAVERWYLQMAWDLEREGTGTHYHSLTHYYALPLLALSLPLLAFSVVPNLWISGIHTLHRHTHTNTLQGLTGSLTHTPYKTHSLIGMHMGVHTHIYIFPWQPTIALEN